jgi:hypothetical protein
MNLPVLEDREIKPDSLFCLRVEPKKRRDFLHHEPLLSRIEFRSPESRNRWIQLEQSVESLRRLRTLRAQQFEPSLKIAPIHHIEHLHHLRRQAQK